MVQMQFIIILIVDMFSVIVAGIVADIGYSVIQGSTIYLHYIGALLAAALFVFFIFPFFKIHRLYGYRLIRQGYRLAFVWFVVLASLIICFYLLNVSTSYSRLWLASWAVLGTIILFFMRLFLVPKLMQAVLKNEIYTNNVVIVGASEVGTQIVQHIQTAKKSKWHILAFFDEDKEQHNQRLEDILIFGGHTALNHYFVEAHEVDEIWITIPLTQIELNEMLHTFRLYPVVIRFIPHLSVFYAIESVEFMLFQHNFWAQMFKRLFDLALTTLLLPMMLLGLPVLALLIRLDTPGPIFFQQCRVGKNGRLFMMWKFRSMSREAERLKLEELEADDEILDDVRFKMVKDPRITRMGQFMRSYSIDELPQLWNVMKGELSLVGPRPALVPEVVKYTPHQLQRLYAMQGITCLWQVSGRSEIPFEQQVELDLIYIKKRSFFYDLWLLLKTIPAVLYRRGAY
jgi:exopolysaccharide biosynthesis polyprenyl glycosylphosphotransferase